MAISDRTRKLLWGRAANRCSICRQEVTGDPRDLKDRHAVLGSECHIVAQSSGGPRALPIDLNEVDDYENLILLCANHHKLVDDQPHEYSVSRLKELKKLHEQWVKETLGPRPRQARLRWVLPKGRRVDLREAKSGADLLELMHRTLAYTFENSDPESSEEAELVGDFLQDLADFGDIYGEIGPANQVREQFEMTRRIAELKDAGLVVFIGEYDAAIEINGEREPFATAIVKITRTASVT